MHISASITPGLLGTLGWAPDPPPPHTFMPASLARHCFTTSAFSSENNSCPPLLPELDPLLEAYVSNSVHKVGVSIHPQDREYPRPRRGTFHIQLASEQYAPYWNDFLLSPATKLRQGNVFTQVCASFCSVGAGGGLCPGVNI